MVVFICIFLEVSNISHLLIYVLAIRISSLEKNVYLSLCPFLIRLFALLVIELHEFLIYILTYVLSFFFAGRFLITDLISLFITGLVRFSISSEFGLGRLYVCRNSSVSSKAIQFACTMLFTVVS